jgi:hypothetical protein
VEDRLPFGADGMQSTTAVGDLRVDHKTCLIMDEVDGMSAGDRGGVGALNGLIKKTRVSYLWRRGSARADSDSDTDDPDM